MAKGSGFAICGNSLIRAGYPGLCLVSHEEQRVDAEIKQVSKELGYSLFFWSVVDGLVDMAKGTNNSANDPLEALIAVKGLKEKSVVLLRYFHLFLIDPNPILIRTLKDVLLEGKTKSKTLIVFGCRLCLPPELERELTVVEFALPGKQELRTVLSGIMESAGITTMEDEARDKAIDAACGLTTIEAENAFALSVVESKAIDPVIVAREKAQAVKKNGILELVETKETLALETEKRLQPESCRIRPAHSQGPHDNRIAGNREEPHSQSHSNSVRRALIKIGRRQNLRGSGRSVRIQPPLSDPNRRSHCPVLPLD